MKRKKVQRRKKLAKGRLVKPTNIRQEVRDLMLNTISERNLTINQLSHFTDAVLKGAIVSIKDLVPTSRKSALRQVLNGIDDAWAVTAKASASSLRHAQRYGLNFAKRDVIALGKKLSALEKELMHTLTHHARRVGDDLGQELNILTKQLKKAGTEVRPAAEAARKAITQHGDALAREVITFGTKAGTQAIRDALLATSGFLEGIGKALDRRSADRSKS